MDSHNISEEEARAINELSPGNLVHSIGDRLKASIDAMVFIGNKYYLDPMYGSDNNNGKSASTAKKTLPAALALPTANKNDILIIIGGALALNLAVGLTISKSYSHIIGAAAPLRFGGRVRIGHAGMAMSPMVTISGDGSIYQNLHFQHGQANAVNLIACSITGLRNYFTGCHFEASLDSVASGGSYAWRAIQIEAAAQANMFYKCTFGSWTVPWASAAGRLVQFQGDNADTIFEDCIFICNTIAATMKMIGFAGAISGGQSRIVFKRCSFENVGTVMTDLTEIPTNGHLFFEDCKLYGITKYAETAANIHITGQQSIATGGMASTPA